MSKYQNNLQNEPHLVDDKVVADVKNKVQKNLSTDTGTNMMVHLFANSDKLVRSSERQYYQNDNDEHGDHNYRNIEDDDHGNGDNDNNDDNDHNLDDDHANYKSSKTAPNVFEQKSQHSDRNNVPDKKHEQYSESTATNQKEINPDDESNWTKEELALRKLDMLRKLGELSKHCGVKLSQNYNMNSDYKTMKFEYELHSGIRSKQNAISWMSGMMILTVQGIEMMNDHFNPFDIKFDNTWSNKVRTDISDYHDVLGKIYEKYTTPGKEMAPELKLFLMLTGSAIMIQGSKIASHLLPNTSGSIDSDPEMIRKLRQQAEQEEKEEQLRRNKLNEHMQNEHRMATQKAHDLQIINNAKADYANIQQNIPIQKQYMDNLNNALVMSDSAKSAKSLKQSTATPMNTYMPPPMMSSNLNLNPSFMQHQAKQNDLIVQNKKLLDMQKMLQGMRDEQKIIDSAKEAKKKQIIHKLPQKQDSDDENSENKSNLSSVSSMSINPNLENILGRAMLKNVKKAESSSEKTSDSSNTSSSSSSSRKKKGLSLNLDNELKRSSSIVPIKKMNKDEAENNIAYEAISLGKKSNLSNDSGSTGRKRGRPKGSMNVRVGK